jgi:hypothetical protein
LIEKLIFGTFEPQKYGRLRIYSQLRIDSLAKQYKERKKNTNTAGKKRVYVEAHH